MFISNNIGIIADDMTGADDTALQFHLRGANTQILLDSSIMPENKQAHRSGLFLRKQETVMLIAHMSVLNRLQKYCQRN